jgi:hypothetical protein
LAGRPDELCESHIVLLQTGLYAVDEFSGQTNLYRDKFASLAEIVQRCFRFGWQSELHPLGA